VVLLPVVVLSLLFSRRRGFLNLHIVSDHDIALADSSGLCESHLCLLGK
jgi:hypothetical protein